MQKKTLIFLMVLLGSYQALATHNRAGEITYRQTGPLTFEITLITFTDPTTLAHQQRTELYFAFSDNTLLRTTLFAFMSATSNVGDLLRLGSRRGRSP